MTGTIRSLRTPGADPRFAVSRRGPYWRPGDSVLGEPWVSLGESNTGHAVLRHGRHPERALEMVERWRLLSERGLLDASRVFAGGAVVNPHGVVTHSWGSVPTPGGTPRWSPILRLLEAGQCGRCGAERWPGCWVAVDRAGCSLCLPELERDDPRVWPLDPGEPPPPYKAGARRPARKRATATAGAVVSPDQGRLE